MGLNSTTLSLLTGERGLPPVRLTRGVRMRSDPRTRAYAARRTTEGLSKSEIKRCIKRYIARELYPLIVASLTG